MKQGKEGNVKKEKKENNSKIICPDKKFNVDVGTLLQVCCSAVESICKITIVDWNMVLSGPAKIIDVTFYSKRSYTDEYSSGCPEGAMSLMISPDGKEAFISYDEISDENDIELTQTSWQNCIIGCELETEEWNDKITLDIAVNGFSFLTQGCCASCATCHSEKILELIELFLSPFEVNITINTKLVDSDHQCCLLKRKKHDLSNEHTNAEKELECMINEHTEK